MILEHGPTHTKDISQAKADLSKFGYCIIPEVLSDSEIEISKKDSSSKPKLKKSWDYLSGMVGLIKKLSLKMEELIRTRLVPRMEV